MSANSDSERRDSSSELLHELEALSQSLSLSSTKLRTASLVLDHSSTIYDTTTRLHPGSISHRLSSDLRQSKTYHVESVTPREKKKGVWSWKPFQALAHVGMHRVSCLFFVKIVSIRGVPPSFHGLRLSVAVRKKETKDGAVRTIPSRVMHGLLDFEETLFVRCHLYYKGGVPPTFESRPFLISVVAVDAPELDLGTNTVDLSLLVKESIERSHKGVRVQEWDFSFTLSGQAKGGEAVVKLGFQIMEEKGDSIYSQAQGLMKKNKRKDLFRFAFGRKESTSSLFSSMRSLSVQESEQELMKEDMDLPELEIVDKGIEKAAQGPEVEEEKSEERVERISASHKVIKEVVHHRRIKELESIAEQIKALQCTFTTDGSDLIEMTNTNTVSQLDAKETTVMREFLQMLELGDEEVTNKHDVKTSSKLEATTEGRDSETKNFISDLGKGLGPVVQTRDGGHLVSMNPFNTKVEREEIPKLAMQISRPFLLQFKKQASGLEIFQKLAAMGLQELNSKLLALMAMDDLMGKTTEKVAFEGVASAIISGRNKEGASFSAARSISTAKMMAKAMVDAKGTWNVKEEAVTIDEMLAFSMLKIKAMGVEGLKIQAGVAEEEAPFNVDVDVDVDVDVSHLTGNEQVTNHLLDSAVPLEEWKRGCSSNDSITLLAMIQLRDPIRGFEPVGGLLIIVVQAARMENSRDDDYDDEGRFKLTGIHVGGLKLKSEDRRREQLGAMQWLVGAGMGKAGKTKKATEAKITGKEFAWSLSSQMIVDKWLKPMRNPNVNEVPQTVSS